MTRNVSAWLSFWRNKQKCRFQHSCIPLIPIYNESFYVGIFSFLFFHRETAEHLNFSSFFVNVHNIIVGGRYFCARTRETSLYYNSCYTNNVILTCWLFHIQNLCSSSIRKNNFMTHCSYEEKFRLVVTITERKIPTQTLPRWVCFTVIIQNKYKNVLQFTSIHISSKMHFESLPNEIILDLFEYISTSDHFYVLIN